jgi:hypothetical protein
MFVLQSAEAELLLSQRFQFGTAKAANIPERRVAPVADARTTSAIGAISIPYLMKARMSWSSTSW